MRRLNRSCLGPLTAFLGVLFVSGCGGGVRPPAQVENRRRAETDAILVRTRAFEFHGSFWVDLHHFLYVVARSRLKMRDATAGAVAPAPGELEKARLSSAEREAIDSAIAVYEKAFAKLDLVFDDEAARQSETVARLENGSSAAGAAGLDPQLASALESAAPAWRRALWPRHLARHRAWLEEMRPILAKYSDSMVAGIENAYGVHWPAEPIRVDLVAYANWAGAYTIARPARTTMMTTNASYSGTGALEMLFHEASHTFDQRILGFLAEEGRSQGRRIPPGLDHAIIFDTAGELTVLRVPGYVAFGDKYGIYTRGPFFRNALKRIWHPHVTGRVSLEDAVRELVAEVGIAPGEVKRPPR